ncbi:MAG: permease-like cell division protein FtsX [Candidatus Gottesmanbacteria bacterium]
MKKTTNSLWTHIRRSPYQSFAAVLTMFITFLLGGIFLLTTGVSFAILQYFESKPQLTVFFMEKAGKPEADVLTTTLTATEKVASTKFVSKEEALAIYKEQNKNDLLLLEMVTADILPASLEVTAKDPRFLAELEPIIKKADGVEEVVFQKDVVDALLSWTNAIRNVGGVLAGLLAIDSLLIIMTVIGMKIALKKEEIDILKLIGASPWYIRRPFILEGGLYGLVGSFGAWLIIMAIVLIFRNLLVSFLGSIPIIQTVLGNMLSTTSLLVTGGFFLTMLLSGFLLGAVGSLVSLGRYIKF